MPQSTIPHSTVNDEVNEVLGSTPGFFVRLGNTLLLAIVAIALGLSAIITYADTIEGSAVIFPYKSAQVFSPGTETRLSALFLKNGDTVAAGTNLLALTDINSGKTDTITAAVSGVVFFQRLLSLNEPVDADKLLLHIQDISGRYKVQIITNRYGSGKIQTGQPVLISLDKFPREEFGQLEASVVSLPVIDSAGNARVEAVLTKDMVTTYGRHADIGTGAHGISAIITGRKSFFSKLFP